MVRVDKHLTLVLLVEIINLHSNYTSKKFTATITTVTHTYNKYTVTYWGQETLI